MRIVLKILATPFALALTISVAVLSFLLSLSAGVLSVLAVVLGGAGVLMLAVQRDMFNGIALLVMGFALSPFGLPALAGWLLDRLDDLNYSLRNFIMG
ncbi:hypothetical protein ADH75_04880 [Flavonifractor plautii]|uniref:Succinate dehydrogenase n=1 Tax=Flavonifractor plautii TaxID=292800 RepID=A0AAX1KHA2_FLAPL|nr:CD1845 family protein [Flavonifractor plautii]ANU41841.1 hypothetical protein A4U99_12570 [Flavonifractor plautii]OXE48911.1 hypothetical protein ADH75_04880 [Flavonifractor plautii]QQR05284.1 hypothetical protein I5Q84_15090 [Flavonifractor plautii]UQA26089.1 CD1845 family protein [Flavonifractor plautii]